MRPALLLLSTFAFLAVAGSSGQSPVSDVSTPPILQPLREAPSGETDWKEVLRVDLDGDGHPNAVVESMHGRGPLSTYTARLKMRALPGTYFLHGGLPVTPGTTIRVADLLQATTSTDLCRIGGSLRTPHQSSDELNGGPWWQREREALGVAVVRDRELHIGYALLSVSKSGAVDVGPGRIQKVDADAVEVRRDR